MFNYLPKNKREISENSNPDNGSICNTVFFVSSQSVLVKKKIVKS